jgi:hypothetical protein
MASPYNHDRPIPTVNLDSLARRLKSLGYIITYKPFMVKNLEGSLSTLARDILSFALRPPETKVVPLVPDISSTRPKKRSKSKTPTPESSSSQSSESLSQVSRSSSNSSDDALESVSLASQDTSSDEENDTCKFEIVDPFTFRKPQMDKARNVLLDHLVEKYGPYPGLETKMMKKIYDYYDTHFFDGLLERQIKSRGHGGINFEVSNKATSIGGSVRLRKEEPIRLMLARSVIEDVTKDKVDALKVNGLPIINRVDAIMRVMEHELVHVALLTSENKAHILEHHGPLFKAMVKGLFGHTGTKHELSINKHFIGKKKVPRDKLRVGKFVAFSNNDQTIGYGRVVKINQTKCAIETPTNSYTIPLDALYDASDMPDKVKAKIDKRIKSQSNAEDFTLGDQVKFEIKDGKRLKGRIVKLNKVTAKVKVEGYKEDWTVYYRGMTQK